MFEPLYIAFFWGIPLLGGMAPRFEKWAKNHGGLKKGGKNNENINF